MLQTAILKHAQRVRPIGRLRGIQNGLVFVLCVAFAACGTGEATAPKEESEEENETWTEATHAKGAAPNYDLLFSMDTVHSIEITIKPSDFESMQADLDDILGDSQVGAVPDIGEGGAPAAGGEIVLTTACDGEELGAACEVTTPIGAVQGVCEQEAGLLSCIPDGVEMPGGEQFPDGGTVQGGGGVDLLSRDPMYIPVEVRHDGRLWAHVGMRYKGNSSLASSHGSGIGKLPFRLDFDEFEDDFPETEDQRFYGFKKLTFSSNWSDDSQLRDTYVSELLRDRGIPAARCAFYRVMVDTGNGPEYWGLYTMIEDPADGAFLDAQMGGSGGNLYKPSGVGADFTTFSTEGFEKKTNEDAADFTDIESAIAALHSDTSDDATWRENLEATFDVELFLTWLAVNTTIVNWDSYGGMAHNYYLYRGEGDQQLRWIPWDHNLSMATGGIGAIPSGGAESQDASVEIFHSDVGSEWPLIQFLLADPVYFERYREGLEHALEGLFAEDAAADRLRELHELISPHVIGSNGERSSHTTISSEDAFDQSIDGPTGLVQHVVTRHVRVKEALQAD